MAHILCKAILPSFSEGCARVQFEASGAIFDRAAIDLEGFSRPLWGIVAMVAGGEQFDHWDMYRRGLANGTNPSHPEFWGMASAGGQRREASARDQRQVELAAIGFALALVPNQIWDPLNEKSKANVANFLVDGRNQTYPDTNWKFFRIFVDLGLRRVGVKHDRQMTEEYLKDLETYYVADGWSNDGTHRKMDYYIPFGFHWDGLVYSILCPEDKERCHRLRERARVFAHQFIHWFDEEGASVPYGRSLTYRFACGSFWGALAVADEEVLPWGVIKGLYLRHLRWWSQKPIARRDGTLTVGYAYPSLLTAEPYNSSGSPYWCMKMFLPLMLPKTHPFWAAEEQALPTLQTPMTLPAPGWVMIHHPGNTVGLSCGPETAAKPFTAEKYSKFAYSTRYAFSTEGPERLLESAVLDSMLGLSEDGMHFVVRESCTTARLSGNMLFCTWSPLPEVHIETWLYPQDMWHVRVHRIQSARALEAVEGGFAVPMADFKADKTTEATSQAWIQATRDASGIMDLASTITRTGRVQTAYPNTNLMFSRTLVPHLVGHIDARTTTVLACAVLASPDIKSAVTAWRSPPSAPDMAHLDREILENSTVVGIYE